MGLGCTNKRRTKQRKDDDSLDDNDTAQLIQLGFDETRSDRQDDPGLDVVFVDLQRLCDEAVRNLVLLHGETGKRKETDLANAVVVRDAFFIPIRKMKERL